MKKVRIVTHWAEALRWPFVRLFCVVFFFDSVIISSSWKGHSFVSHFKVFPLSDVSLWHGIWPAPVSAEPHGISGVLSPPCGRYKSQHLQHGLLSEQCNVCLLSNIFFLNNSFVVKLRYIDWTVLINPKSKLTVFLIYLCAPHSPQPQPNLAINGTTCFRHKLFEIEIVYLQICDITADFVAEIGWKDGLTSWFHFYSHTSRPSDSDRWRLLFKR